MTLVEFLRARLDEDEAVAREAVRGPWYDDCSVAGDGFVAMSPNVQVCKSTYDCAAGNATHIARHDPARVLAEVEAKRRIVNLLTYSDVIRGERCDLFHDPDVGGHVGRLLALPYADHPDYREEWKP